MEEEKKPVHEYFLKAIFEEGEIEENDSSDTSKLLLMSNYHTPDLVLDNEYSPLYRVPFNLLKDKIFSEEEAFNLRVNGWKLSDDKEYVFFKP